MPGQKLQIYPFEATYTYLKFIIRLNDCYGKLFWQILNEKRFIIDLKPD